MVVESTPRERGARYNSAVAARSFLADPENFERGLAGARASVGKLGGALVFVSGALAQAGPRVAEIARKSLRRLGSPEP
jgi:hypothetical protein